MNNTGRTIAKNASFLMASQVITWGLALILTVFLPRYLGAAGIGKYQLASSIWALMSIFIAFGMDTMLTKEIARDPARLSVLFSTSVVLRLAIFSASVIVVAVYTQLAKYSMESLVVVLIFGLSAIAGQLAAACAAALQGLERMEYLSLAGIAGKVFTTVVCIVLLLNGYRVVALAFVFLGAALLTLAIQFIALKRIHRISISIDFKLVGWMLKASFPYLLVFGFIVAYNQVDTILISLLVNEKELGWYSAANNLFGTFLFIPTVFMSAVFPALSRMHKVSPESLPKLLSKSFDLLLLVGVPLGLGVAAISGPLVIMLYGPDFANSGPNLLIMGLVLIFTYQNMILGQFFISSDRQNVWIVIMAVVTVLTIPLDLVLIPWCQATFGNGAIGGALSFLATEACMTVYGLLMVPKGVLNWQSGWLALRVVIAGLGMTAIVWSLRGLFIALPIGVGIIVYLVEIIIMRVISVEDWALIRSVGTGALNRLRGNHIPQPSLSGE